MKEYIRNCPKCKNPIKYGEYKMFWKARKNNSSCRSCFHKSMIGHSVSDITKKKIGEANKISLLGNIPWNKGKNTPPEVIKKLVKAHIGMKYGEETKRKKRESKMKRLIELGIGSKIDTGANEFFENLNKQGYNFKSKRFLEIGYDADGYDENKHVWCEFDTPYHKFPSQKERDSIRQKNIIDYFEKLGNPLCQFIRVTANKTGQVLETKIVYKGGS